MVVMDRVIGITRDPQGSVTGIGIMSESLGEYVGSIDKIRGGRLIMQEAKKRYPGQLVFEIDNDECIEFPLDCDFKAEESHEIIEAVRKCGFVRVGDHKVDAESGLPRTEWHCKEVTVYESLSAYYESLAHEAIGELPPHWGTAS
jgi:hypothetical protein